MLNCAELDCVNHTLLIAIICTQINICSSWACVAWPNECLQLQELLMELWDTKCNIKSMYLGTWRNLRLKMSSADKRVSIPVRVSSAIIELSSGGIRWICDIHHKEVADTTYQANWPLIQCCVPSVAWGAYASPECCAKLASSRLLDWHHTEWGNNGITYKSIGLTLTLANDCSSGCAGTTSSLADANLVKCILVKRVVSYPQTPSLTHISECHGLHNSL